MGKQLLNGSEAYNDDLTYCIDLPGEKDLPYEEKEGMLIVSYDYDCNCNTILSLPHLPVMPWVMQGIIDYQVFTQV
jgi:hypothetical protein